MASNINQQKRVMITSFHFVSSCVPSLLHAADNGVSRDRTPTTRYSNLMIAKGSACPTLASMKSSSLYKQFVVVRGTLRGE